MLEQHAMIFGYIDPVRAEGLLREVLEINEQEHGADHEKTIDAAESLASLLRKREKYEEAETLTRGVLAQCESRLDPDDPAVLSAKGLLGRILQERGDLDEAERLQLQVLEGCEQAPEPNVDSLYSARANLAGTWIAQGNLAQARELFETTMRPEDFVIEKWFPSESDEERIDVDESIVIFWEPWCPFSEAYVPELQKLHADRPDSSVQFVGLTSLSQDSTEEQALGFIESAGLTFANAQSTGETFRELGFTGYPSAVALKGGHVVFKGHPDLITPAFLAGLEREIALPSGP